MSGYSIVSGGREAGRPRVVPLPAVLLSCLLLLFFIQCKVPRYSKAGRTRIVPLPAVLLSCLLSLLLLFFVQCKVPGDCESGWPRIAPLLRLHQHELQLIARSSPLLALTW